MGNSVAVAKLPEGKNSCEGIFPDDLEVVFKGIHEVYTVDEHGTAMEAIETYMMESYPAYYDCQTCGEVWDITELGQDEAFKKAKEHFNENS